MVRITRLLLLTKVTSNIGEIPVAAFTSKGLYKFLLRQCNKLPNVEISAYYKHHIRQSFNQHADETDPERVTQIINQAAKDIGWVLRKLKALKKANRSKVKMAGSVMLEAKVSSETKFFHALSTFTARPELLIPQVRSTDVVWCSLDSQLKSFYDDYNSLSIFDFIYSTVYHKGKYIPTNHVGEFCGSLHENTIQAWLNPNCKFKKVALTRLIHHKPTKDNKFGWTSKVLEIWDFNDNFVQLHCMDYSSSNSIPPLASLISLTAKYSSVEKIVRLTLLPSTDPLVVESFELYKITVVPKIFEWMSDSYNPDPPTLTRLRARPLGLVTNSSYWLLYDLLKSGPAESVKRVWKEATDPIKFIHEDIGIAAYIGSFIYGESKTYRPDNNTDCVDIIDLGCGNGLLCFFLSQIFSVYSKSANITGFDIRKRKIWMDLLKQRECADKMKLFVKGSNYTGPRSPALEETLINFTLTERTFVPHMIDDIIDYYGRSLEDRKHRSLWLIGNHSDELTPWIPVVARILNATGFFIIPCCPYDFFNKYQRKGKLPGSSIYQNYIEYICTIGDTFGYHPILEKLRIPSTKNICLVGLDCSRKFADGVLSKCVVDVMNQLKKGDEGTSFNKFVPRRKESSKENPKLDRIVANRIVDKIFKLLVSSSNSVQGEDWYEGRNDITFSAIISILTKEERDMLKGKGRGLRTLVKSNKHLFVMDSELVKLRIPNERDIENVSEASHDRIKTRDCYFKINHPQGCPLADTLCAYKH